MDFLIALSGVLLVVFGIAFFVVAAVRGHLIKRHPRCVYCGVRKDRAEGTYCQTRHVVSAWHLFSDGSRTELTGFAPGDYDEDDD